MKAVDEIVLEGHPLRLSNLSKVLYPSVGFTKAQVIDYYARAAPALLPHLRDRPLTLKRYPDGVDAPYFYEKNCPKHRPPWVKTTAVWSGARQREIRYCLVNDLATLVWLANLADLELHTSLSLARDVDQPTALAFDLDPGAPAGLVECCQVALWLRSLLSPLGLKGLAKTSGSKGLQVYFPLNDSATYQQTKSLARAVALDLERRHGDRVVSSQKKSLRSGKVLIDWSQNDPHKTTVSVYSLRAKERPTVSTPLRWEEVEDATRRGDAASLVCDSAAVLERIERWGDLFAPVLTIRQKLPRMR